MILMKNKYEGFPNHLTFSIYIGNKEIRTFMTLDSAYKYMIKSLNIMEEEAHRVTKKMEQMLNNPRENIVTIRVN